MDDQLAIWVERVVSCLFFFWPPVHWVTRKLQEARELACDERAIERGALTATDYASHLLDVVAGTRGRAAHGALAIGHTAARLERRIDWLLEDSRPQQPSLRHAAVSFLLLMAALVGLRPQLAAPDPAATFTEYPASELAEGGCDEQVAALQCGP